MAIVTDGLIGYWHYKQGVSGNVWENIAPDTKGNYNGKITGAILQSDGVYFDGVDDMVLVEKISNTSPSIAIEIYYLSDTDGMNPFSIYKNTNFRMFSQKIAKVYRNFGDITTGESFHTLSNAKISIPDSQPHHIVHQYNAVTQKKELYVNGLLDTSDSVRRNYLDTFDIRFAANHYNGVNSSFTRGKYTYVRLYSRALNSQEIAQNYAVGTAIGLDDPLPVNEPPSVTIVSQSRQKLSPIPPMDKSTLKFKFDQNVTDWAVMVLGSDYSTGTMAGSGKNVAKDTEIAVDITHRMLYQEGDNRINIYGRNSDGQWTPYD